MGRHFENWLLHGIELTHDAGALVIYNALDENGLSDGAMIGPDFRRTTV